MQHLLIDEFDFPLRQSGNIVNIIPLNVGCR
jgi:hypothetical protein